MKLGNVREGIIYSLHGFEFGTWTQNEGFESNGSVPNFHTGIERATYATLHCRLPKAALSPLIGYTKTGNAFAFGDSSALVNIGRTVLRTGNGGESWKQVHTLPASSSPQGVLPTSFCDAGGELYLAEYGGGDVPGRIISSSDGGKTWSVFVERKDVRHFHGVFEDPYTGTLWATTGDQDAESLIGRIESGSLVPVGRGSQDWRSVDLAFTDESVYWGVDCSYANRNEIYRLTKDDYPGKTPKPEVLGFAENSVFFVETLRVVGETWLVVSTASETGIDSTAPTEKHRNASSRRVQVLTKPLGSHDEGWYEICCFERRRTVGDYFGPVPTSNAHAMLACDPIHGLVVNPYNTTTRNGRIFTVPPERFRDRDFKTPTPAVES